MDGQIVLDRKAGRAYLCRFAFGRVGSRSVGDSLE
jgi:hypothetical protein